MPKVPVDYSKTSIYKLVHKDDFDNENIYIGHSTDIRVRKNLHKSDCNNPNSKNHNLKVYQYIRENGGWDEWCMIEIEKYPCKDSNEAIARERVIQAEMKAKLNMRIAGRTKQEHYQDNRDHILEYKKQYRQDNRDKISKYNKQYSQDNREYISEQKKQHYQDNRDKLLEQHKQYYQDNRDEISKYNKQYYQDNREKIICECGCVLSKYSLRRHQKSDKHAKLMSS